MLWFRNHVCAFSVRSPGFLDLGVVWFGFRKQPVMLRFTWDTNLVTV